MIGKFFRDRSKESQDKSREDQSMDKSKEDQNMDKGREDQGMDKSREDQGTERYGRMRDIIKKIVKAIVDSPDDVNISEIDGGRTTIIELKVAKDDIGKVIGKKGRTISAIRTLLASAGGKEKIRYVLELLED
jgi:uncharacterized protein